MNSSQKYCYFFRNKSYYVSPHICFFLLFHPVFNNNPSTIILAQAEVARLNYNLLLITLSLYFQYGDTALHNAAYMNNTDIINMILDHAVQIDVKDKVSIIKATIMLTTIPCTRFYFCHRQHITMS